MVSFMSHLVSDHMAKHGRYTDIWLNANPSTNCESVRPYNMARFHPHDGLKMEEKRQSIEKGYPWDSETSCDINFSQVSSLQDAL